MDILGRVDFPRQYFRGVSPFKAVAALGANTLSFLFHIRSGFYLEKLQGVHPFHSVASLVSNACPILALGLYGFSLSGVSLQDYSWVSPFCNHEPTLRVNTQGLVFASYVSYLYTFFRRGE